LRLVTVGTGATAPHPARVQSASLLEAGDVRLLVDCGGGAVFRMAQFGLSWSRITHVAFTHYHADHTNDLPNLIYSWRYGLVPPRAEPVQLIGPPGLADRLERLAGAFGERLLEGPPSISVVELPPGQELGLSDAVRIGSRKVPHTDESVAYSVSGHGRRVVVTGDTGFDAGLGAWAAGCDVLLCECSLPDSLALPLHLTPRQCGMLAAAAMPGLLALTHFYPPVEAEPIASQVAERFGGRVVLCTDGWSHEIEAR
jgi:ribonuclease BN (tRNA processing enzyme)